MSRIKTYLLWGICFCVTACSHQNFSISGQIKQYDGNSLYIDEINPDGITVLDTVLLINGNFSYNFKSSEEGLFRLRLNDTVFVPFMGGGNDKLQFSGDAKDLIRTYQIKGNESSEILLEVQQRINSMYQLTDSLSKIFKQAQIEGKIDSITPYLDSCYYTHFQSCKSYLKGLIENHMGQLVTLPLFYQRIGTRSFFSEKNDSEFFMDIYQNLKDNYPDNKHVLAIQEKYGLE